MHRLQKLLVVLLLLGCVVGVASAAESIQMGKAIPQSVTSADPFTITYGNIQSNFTEKPLITAKLTSSKTVQVDSIIPTFTEAGSDAYVMIKSPNGATVKASPSSGSISGQTLRAGVVYDITVQLTKVIDSTSVMLELYGTPDGETTFTVIPETASATAFMVNVNGTEYSYTDLTPVPTPETKEIKSDEADPETGEVDMGNGVAPIANASAPKVVMAKDKAEQKYSGTTINPVSIAGEVTISVATSAANGDLVNGIVAGDTKKQPGMTAQTVVEIKTPTSLAPIGPDEYYAVVITATNVGLVTHQKSDGTWETPMFVSNGDGTITVFLKSFSPVVVYAAAVVVDNGGADNGLELLAAAKATPTANVTVTPTPTVDVTVAPTTVPTDNATAVPTGVPATPTASTTGGQGTGAPTPTSAPAPILGILAGLGVAAIILRRN